MFAVKTKLFLMLFRINFYQAVTVFLLWYLLMNEYSFINVCTHF